ncbi:hypothetical protein C8R44DRAFT_736255 [Mycena epipterygia]|nr:hypothetical protein C8R44DRAFT_736255 [Mycena epipterygia]
MSTTAPNLARSRQEHLRDADIPPSSSVPRPRRWRNLPKSACACRTRPPVDRPRATLGYLGLPSVYPGRHTCTTTCRHMLVYLSVPLSTSGYLRWTAFSDLCLPWSLLVH